MDDLDALALEQARGSLDAVVQRLADQSEGGRDLDGIGPEAFGLARQLAQLEAADAMLAWGEAHGARERALARTYLALACAELQGWLARHGWSRADGLDAYVAQSLETARLSQQGAELLEHGCLPRGLGDEHAALREAVSRFAQQELAPLAEGIHREDSVVPERILAGLAELGVFGISIPEAYGGCYTDHTAMVVATEALSEVSLGAGGSVITRPEICAKALLAGGTEEQKQAYLPDIASGRRMVSVAVSEPDAGSDVAALRVRATKTDGGYLLSGEKTWCTFAGRADLLVFLARTGEDRHRGLTLFLVDKPATIGGDTRGFSHQQESGGTMVGRAIPTVGYRGMHSFAVTCDDWFVPESARVGAEGEGFALVMQGFVGGRIQTAARAVGVMQAALDRALDYANSRRVFGRLLGELPLTRCKLVQMAARVQAGRQLAYRTCERLDGAEQRTLCEREASLVKLMTCRDAEWVTREAMQLHGGMGYSEEFAVSRLWLDARVLSIFEGAEEVLALRVVARGVLRERALTQAGA